MSVSWRVATGWALAGAAVLLALYLLIGILLPFIVGMAAAYLLDPLADWLQRHGFRRGAATLLITALFFALLALLVLVLLPLFHSMTYTDQEYVIDQLRELAATGGAV